MKCSRWMCAAEEVHEKDWMLWHVKSAEQVFWKQKRRKLKKGWLNKDF